jgi:hypothetical protein
LASTGRRGRLGTNVPPRDYFRICRFARLSSKKIPTKRTTIFPFWLWPGVEDRRVSAMYDKILLAVDGLARPR